MLYYPGCSLRNSYPEFEKSALETCTRLGIDLAEIPEWNCCGVNFSLSDNIMRHLGAVRTLISAQEMPDLSGDEKVVALCSMCYNVMKRVNLTLKEDAEALENVNLFIDDEVDYRANLEVIHFLQLLRDDIGFDHLSDCVTVPLKGLKIAPYYGCALIRPESIAIDAPENPSIMEEFIRSVGADPVDYPYKTECCGNYHTVMRKEIVELRSKVIVDSAKLAGADLVVSTCPLCTYNLRLGVRALEEKTPILFFSQILALSLGVNPHLSPEREKNVRELLEGMKSYAK